MRYTLPLILICIVGLAVALGAQASPHARVIDRTMLCAASLNGGIYEVELSAQAGSGRQGSAWTRPATTLLTTGQSNSASEALDHALAWALAGEPAREATVIPDPFAGVRTRSVPGGRLRWPTAVA